MKKFSYLTTSQVAQAAGVHPNTVRLYEQWGFLPPIERSPAGYRRFTQEHIDQMCMARLALHGDWPGSNIRQSAANLIRLAASGDLGGALELAYRHLALVQAERAQAEAAAQLLQRWANGVAANPTTRPLHPTQTAQLLDVTLDILRHWERNGLICPPRDPHNHYRLYGQAEISRLRVIRMLSHAGYSTMAILRMLTHLDQGKGGDLRQVLDTPRPDEDIFTASDHWLSTLAEQENRARQMILMLEERIASKAVQPSISAPGLYNT